MQNKVRIRKIDKIVEKNAEKKEKIERIQKWRKTSIFDFETPFRYAVQR